MKLIRSALIIFLCLFASPTLAAWTVINHICAGQTGAGGPPLTSATIDTTAANLLVVVASYYWDVGLSGDSFNDSKSNTWNLINSITTNGDRRSTFYYAYAASTGTGHSFTLSQITNQLYAASFCVIALAGAQTANPIDVYNFAKANGTTVQPVITPNSDNQIVITGLGAAGTNTLASIGSSFTIAEQIHNGESDLTAIAYKIQTSAGPENPTWTLDQSFNNNDAHIASFKQQPVSVTTKRHMVIVVE